MLSIVVNESVSNRQLYAENMAYNLKKNGLSDDMKIWFSSGVCHAYNADGKAQGAWEEEKPETAIDADLLLNGYFDTMVNLYGDEAILFYNDADEFSGFIVRRDDTGFGLFHHRTNSDEDEVYKKLRSKGFIY